MQSAPEHPPTECRRRPDGSIDTEFYVAKARRLRRMALRDAGRRLRRLPIALPGLPAWHPGARVTPRT